jgi:NADH-quinone oxidoreductase subunit C
MWELFGFNIKNHDDLKCFLLPEDWDQGHPMRKDWDAPDFVRFPEL